MAKKTTQAQTLDIFGDVPAPADMPTLAPPVEAPVVPAVAVENQTVDKAGDTPALDPVDNPAIAPCRVDQQVRSRMSARTLNPGIISTVAELLLGNKNERLSKEDDVRFGTNGSMSICPSKNTFYDHEANEGGGLLAFVIRHGGATTQRDAAAWLEFKGLIAGQTMPVVPSAKPTPTAPKKASLGPVIARYDYQGEDGAVLFQVRRHEPKDFRQYGFIGGEWVPTVKGIKQVPYRLPQLLAAPIDAVIYIVEGEKDADRLVHLGLFATTCAGGAGKWRATHSEYFQGRRAIIIPDNDSAGRDHAQVVAKSLSGIAASVGVLTLPGLPEKGDVSDWLNAGGTVEELGQLEAVAPVQAHAEEEWDAELMRQAEELDQERLTAGFGPLIDFDGNSTIATVLNPDDDGVLHGYVGQHFLDEATDPSTPPEPLRATLPRGADYPVKELGEVLGAAALALHEVGKMPLALCAQCVLSAASLAVQSHFDVILPWGERKPVSLFFLTVGESGERKTAADEVVFGAARVYERKIMDKYRDELKEYAEEYTAWKVATEAAQRAATKGKATASQVREAMAAAGEKPESPIVPLRFVSDPTVEGLFKLLAASHPSVGLFSDEGGLIIGGHAMNSDNVLKTYARLCKFWDGSPFDRVRAGDGADILYGRRLSLHLMAQGDVMVKLLSDSMANNQGFLARCLVAWPESTIGTRHDEGFSWAGDRPELKRLFAVLSKLTEATPRTTDARGQELDPVALELTPEAKELASWARNQFETLMAKGGELEELRDRASKALENAVRVAGVLTAIEEGMAAKTIDAPALAQGLEVVQWYLAEMLRIRGAAVVPREVLDAEVLSAWLEQRGIKRFRTAPLLTNGPAQLRNKPRLMAAIGALTETGHLQQLPPGTEIDGTKARKSWEVNHYVV